MPKLLCTRDAVDAEEERTIRKLAASRYAPDDWIRRAGMVVRSWDALRTSAIAAELGCHQQSVRERLARFNAEGLDGLGDRPGAGRKRRLTEAERGVMLTSRAGPRPVGSCRSARAYPSPRTRRATPIGRSTPSSRRRAGAA